MSSIDDKLKLEGKDFIPLYGAVRYPWRIAEAIFSENEGLKDTMITYLKVQKNILPRDIILAVYNAPFVIAGLYFSGILDKLM